MELVMDRTRKNVKPRTGLKARIAAWAENKYLRRQLDGMQADYAIMSDQYQLLKEHIFELEKKLTDINVSSEDQESVEMETPYSVAILLAKKGCERGEIIRECGLTDSEADLILALHTESTLVPTTSSATN